MLYFNLSTYLREKYGKRLKKICIDGGFSCPNRDGKCGTGGCIYCGERGAGEHIDAKAGIAAQVKRALSGAKEDDAFIAYFQNFTNTYAPIDVLRERYDSALTDDRIKILAIGTRPDCIDEEICELISEYAKEREVWVELGLQTASDQTARIINRGYNTKTFDDAYRLLSERGIKVVVHMIIGLPTESIDDFKYTADYIASKHPFGVKIHSIYVMQGTALADLYLAKHYTPPTLEEYAAAAAYAVARMPRDTVIHRLTGDCPRDLLIAPNWNKDKNEIISHVIDHIKSMGWHQGALAD